MDPVLDYAPVAKRVLWRNLPSFFWRLMLRAAPIPLLLIFFFMTATQMGSLRVGATTGRKFWHSLMTWQYVHRVRLVVEEDDTIVYIVSGVDSYFYVRVKKAELLSQAAEGIRDFLDDATIYLESDGTVEPELQEQLALLAGSDFGNSPEPWRQWIKTVAMKTNFSVSTLETVRAALIAPPNTLNVDPYDRRYRNYWRYHWSKAVVMALCLIAAGVWLPLQRRIKLPPLREA